jgi:hypothetical protein
MHEIVSQPRPVEWQVGRESRVVARVTIEDVLLGHTTPSFACATMDWWPRSKCDYGTCSWGAAGPAVSMPTVNLRYVDTSTCPGSSFVVLSSALSAAPTGKGGWVYIAVQTNRMPSFPTAVKTSWARLHWNTQTMFFSTAQLTQQGSRNSQHLATVNIFSHVHEGSHYTGGTRLGGHTAIRCYALR